MKHYKAISIRLMVILNLALFSPLLIIFGASSLWGILNFHRLIANGLYSIAVTLFVTTSILIFTNRYRSRSVPIVYIALTSILWFSAYSFILLAENLTSSMGSDLLSLAAEETEAFRSEYMSLENYRLALKTEAQDFFPNIWGSPFALFILTVNAFGTICLLGIED